MLVVGSAVLRVGGLTALIDQLVGDGVEPVGYGGILGGRPPAGGSVIRCGEAEAIEYVFGQRGQLAGQLDRASWSRVAVGQVGRGSQVPDRCLERSGPFDEVDDGRFGLAV